MSAADCQFCLNFYPAFCLDLCSVSWTVYTLALTPHFPPIIHSLQQCWRTCWQVKNEKRWKNFIVWRKFVFDRQHFHISELFLSLTRSLFTDGVQIKLDGVNQIQGYHGACARSQYAASAALGVLPQAWCQDRCCSISSPLCPPPPPFSLSEGDILKRTLSSRSLTYSIITAHRCISVAGSRWVVDFVFQWISLYWSVPWYCLSPPQTSQPPLCSTSVDQWTTCVLPGW